MTQDPDRSFKTLLRLAGEREMPSAEATERARLAAEQAWRRALADRRRRRGFLPIALAAGLGLVALFTYTRREVAPPAVAVARIEALDGAATLRSIHGRAAVADGTEVLTGSSLATLHGRVAVSFADALSLRLDENTQLRFDSHDHVTLLAGSLYVDSGGLGAGPPLVITTPAGEVRHIGTQFQVRVSADATGIRVREGRVALRPSGGSADRMVAAGDLLEVRGGEERWQHGLASFGDAWEWSAGISPALAIEDRPMAEFLAWMAREHGWQLQYADEGLQQRTHDIRLHGSLEGLRPEAMLERVSLVTGLPVEASDGVLRVGVRP